MTLSNEWYNTELENSELETLHRSPTVEYSFYNAVRSGDMEAVIKNCSEDEFIRLEGTGVLSRRRSFVVRLNRFKESMRRELSKIASAPMLVCRLFSQRKSGLGLLLGPNTCIHLPSTMTLPAPAYVSSDW